MFMSHFLAIIFYSRETWRSWKSRIIVLEKFLFGAPKILQFHAACPLDKQLSHFACLGSIDFLLVLVNDFVRGCLAWTLPHWASELQKLLAQQENLLVQDYRMGFFSSPVTMLNSFCCVCFRFQYTGLTMRPTQYLRRLILQFWKPS